MAQDILFRTENFIFSYRVAGLLIRDGKILLQKPVGDDYAMIGGHVSAFETAEEALKREYMEELHAHIRVDRLFAVGEVFFPWGEKPCHQIGLYYLVHLEREDEIPLEGSFHGYDELENERIDLDFCWVPLEDLEKGIKAYPQELIPALLQDPGEVVHFVSRQPEEAMDARSI